MQIQNTDIIDLVKKIKTSSKPLLCIGIGQFLKDACNCFEQFGFVEMIAAVFDNHPREFVWHDRIYHAKSVDEIVQYASNAIIYVSSSYYVDIVEQLNAISELSDTVCYIHAYVIHTPIPYMFPEPKTVQSIPKRIHYFWFGKKEIPEKNLAWMESWKKYCPEYDIVRWDESNYDYAKNEYMRTMYNKGKYAFVSDYARLDVIYEYGGIYLDTDVELIDRIDKFTYNTAFCAMASSMGGPTLGVGFGGCPHFGLFKEWLDCYDSLDCSVVSNSSASSGAYRLPVLQRYGYQSSNVLNEVKNMTIYPTDVMCPQNHNGLPIAFSENTVSIHHFDATWQTEDVVKRREAERFRYEEFHSKYFGYLKRIQTPPN